MTGTPSPAPGSPEALPQARRRKRSPLPTLLGVLAVGGLAGFILFGNVGKSLEYFVTPTEYQQQQDRLQGKAIRIGGLVKDVKNDPQSGPLRRREPVEGPQGRGPRSAVRC